MNAAFGFLFAAFLAGFLLATFFFVAIGYSLQNVFGVGELSTAMCALRMLQRRSIVNGSQEVFHVFSPMKSDRELA
jgi:hypothetical protein